MTATCDVRRRMSDPSPSARVRLSHAHVARLRAWMVDRQIPGSAESFISGLLTGRAEPIDDAAIIEIMAFVDQYITLHGARWMDVLARRAKASDTDPSAAIEPELN